MAASEQPLGPADVPQLHEVLKGALSNDRAVQKAAEATLHSLEARSGYCSCLAEVVGSREVDHSSRWLAVTQLKNCVSKYWRMREAAGGIAEGEKAHLRQRLLGLIEQEDNQVAVQVSVVFSRVARYDYPRAWPSLFGDLLARAGAGSSALAGRRVYHALHLALKELASKRLAADQRVFAEVTSQLFGSLWQQWSTDTSALSGQLSDALSQPGGSPPHSLLLTFERWLLLLKALRRMLLFGYPSDAKSLQPVPAVAEVAPQLLACLHGLLALRQPGTRGSGSSRLGAMTDRGTLKLLKTLAAVQETHPWTFYSCGMLIPSLHLCCERVVAPPPGGSGSEAAAWEAFVVRCMLMLQQVQRCAAYRGTASSILMAPSAKQQAEGMKAQGAEVQHALAAFWAGDRLSAVVTALVERFLPLTAGELGEWDASAEAFHHEAEAAGQADRLRPVAEKLFLTLLQDNREALARLLLSMLQRAGAACPPAAQPAHFSEQAAVAGVPAAVLYKEAVYAAAGVGAYELADYIDFGPWLHGALLQEIACGEQHLRPVRRRAIKVVGDWVAKVGTDARRPVYAALLGALGDDDDAIKMMAAHSLHALVDDWDFREEAFREFLEPVFARLTAFLMSATELDTQSQVFNLINLIIDRLADEIRPFAPGLLRLLPHVWDAAAGQSLLRIQVMLALMRLTNVLGPESPEVHPVALPLVRYATDVRQPEAVALLEDGLALWLVLLRNAPRPDPELLAPFDNVAALLQQSTEHISVVCGVMSSCVLLGGGTFLGAYGGALAAALAGLVGNVNERGSMLLLPVMDLVLQAFPQQGPQLLDAPLQRLLASLLAGNEGSCVAAAAVGLFARMLLQNSPAFLQFFERAAVAVPLPHGVPAAGSASASLLLAFVDFWLDRFDNITSAPQRKLSALAACQLPCLPLPGLLARLDLVLAAVTSVWCETEADNDTGLQLHGRDMWAGVRGACDADEGLDSAVAASADAEGEAQRRAAQQEADPMAKMQVGAFLKQQMAASGAAHGRVLQEAVAHLDPVLQQQLQAVMMR